MRFVVVGWISGLVACGDGVLPTGTVPPPSTGDVSVRVTDDTDVGIPGCQVYFQTIDSRVEATAITGSDGMATAHVTDGGFVTIVDGANTTTFAG
ncbi:MAG TPA: hypothetical protein VGO00_08765, partial [Kofleriaceae bacterium]|nr:hypothetical protein [Kofleriaceae bacterium]